MYVNGGVRVVVVRYHRVLLFRHIGMDHSLTKKHEVRATQDDVLRRSTIVLRQDEKARLPLDPRRTLG
jgi:hypothetical protein